MRFAVTISVVCALGVSSVLAQDSPSLYDFTRANLSWYTIETDHFRVHFHESQDGNGSRRSAMAVAEIAEDIYGPITDLYDFRPDSKVSVVIRDFEDYSNGAAYFFDNVIVLWTPSLDTPFRGRHDWLRNVVTHEFTHIVQVQSSMKANRRLPFQYFQLLTYEDVRRPDVLYGYPNGIVTYPIPVLSNPAWLAEGTAQFQREEMDFDTWDSHRDMVLRSRVLAGKALSLSEMGGFYSHNSLEREAVYNQGFAFTQFLATEYGEKVLRDVSVALRGWRVWTFDRAAARAFGESGREVYDRWMERLTNDYSVAIDAIRQQEVSGELIEGDGFLNLYPRYDPAGRLLAYLTNRGQDFSVASLVVVDSETGNTLTAVEGITGGTATFTCSMGNRVAPAVYGSFDWSPDGTRLAYARRSDNSTGAYYSDLYEYDLEAKREDRVTTDARARSPAYSPDGRHIAFVSERDGTANLYLVERQTGRVQPITTFRSGEQIGDPSWHPDGGSIVVTHDSGRSNGIYSVDVVDGAMSVVIDSVDDERQPWIDSKTGFLYFAADRGGIFNLYRAADAGVGKPEQLTNVVGGAFMPSTHVSGDLVFARYDWDGYKIARVRNPKGLDGQHPEYRPPDMLIKWRRPQTAAGSAVSRVDTASAIATSRQGVAAGGSLDRARAGRSSERAIESGLSEGEIQVSPDSVAVTRYGNVFTSFSFFPVLRLDQYVSRRRGRADVRLRDRTRMETLLRNTKLGFYVASREVLDGLSMLGGVLVGPASGEAESFGDYFAPSSLIDLERDLFVRFDYGKGIFFKSKRWSPQFGVQLFNVRRNVDNGLAFEELACTACFPPDTTLADLSYNLWELDIVARSKLTRHLLFELGYRFSPYRVTTNSFFSTEFQQTIPASSSRYYIGRAIRARLMFEALRPHRHADVVRDGVSAVLEYEFEPGRLLDRFEVENGLLSPKYVSFRNHQVTVDLRYGRRILFSEGGAPHGVSLRLRGSSILGKPVDDFFDDYVGGLIGARGYPFYALGGNETLWVQAAYSVPLLPGIQRQLWFVYADKLYARFYADAAYAWSGKFPGLSEARRDVGAELRLGLGSFYLLPTAVFVSATYGIDEFEFALDEDFVTPDGRTSVSYGRDLQWHFGVLFGFDI